MNNAEEAKVFFKGAWSMFGNGLEALWKVALTHKKATAAIVILFAGGALAVPLFLKTDAAHKEEAVREVTVVKVADVSGIEPISVIATVRSVREANVAANASGRVSAVYRSLGDAVSAGTVIAEIENARERAAVAQARAALEKAKSGVAVGTIGVSNAETVFRAAQSAAEATIAGSYATLQDAVTRKADQMFSNPEGVAPSLTVSSFNSQLENDAENKRVLLSGALARWRGAIAPQTNVEQYGELTQLVSEAALVADFLSTLASVLQAAIPSQNIPSGTIATYRADIDSALSEVNALRATLTNTAENLTVKEAAVDIARENVAQGESGKTADIAVAESALAGASANLENTIIRAPISGTINRIDIELGNFLSASIPVVYITNPQGLEAVLFVSGRDLGDIAIGAAAMVGGTVPGTVVKKAHALDPATKKAEVRVSIPNARPFVSGQATTVSIERSVKNATRVITVPLSSVKITPDGAVVFTVTEDAALAARHVVLGIPRGAKIEIEEGLSIDDAIVLDARGLNEGERVTVKQ